MNDGSPRRAILALALSAIAVPALGQAPRVVVLENADSLVGRVIDGEDARELIGNVRLSQGNVRIRCDRALQFLKRGDVELTGNVVVQDDSVTLRSPRGIYHRDERRAQAFDDVTLDDGRVTLRAGFGEYLLDAQTGTFRANVTIRDSASTVTADTVDYSRVDSRSIARGRVRVESPADNLVIYGRRLEHDPSRRHDRVTGDPLLIQRDTTGGRDDTLLVTSLVMEASRDSAQLLEARDSVRIIRNDLAAIAHVGRFAAAGDSMQLRGAPVIWYGGTQVSGDSIDIYLERKQLRRARVVGNALTVSRSDSLLPLRFDQLTGETMVMDFAGGRLARVEASVRARSVYFVYEERAANGVVTSSGDAILLQFSEGKVDAIRITGGVEGQYVPEPLVTGREVEHRVPGFLWREDRPLPNHMKPPWQINERPGR